jgi:hypothetical protein
LAVFVSHSDESGVKDPRGAFLVGGYVDSELAWPGFAKAWRERVLDGPPEIPYLHMNEIMNSGWRTKHGISLFDAENRIEEAVSVIACTGSLMATLGLLERGDLEDTVQRKLKEQRGMHRLPIGLDEPDYLCFLVYSEFTIAQVYRRHPNTDKVNFVVSLKQKVTHHIKEFHEELKTLMEPPLKNLVGELLPARMEAILPLQAADVFCWHVQRSLSGALDRTSDRRLKILGETIGYPYLYEKEELDRIADGIITRMITRENAK